MAQVTDYTAILSGSSWSGASAVMNAPAFVTYSFDTVANQHAANSLFNPAFRSSFAAFTAAEREVARAALAQWADASGLVLLEVKPNKGDIRLGTYDFSLDSDTSGFSGFGYYPSTDIRKFDAYRSEIGGDVFIDHGLAGDTFLLLHEVGHALGFKHPFEDTPTLPSWLDNHANTVMSYSGSSTSQLGRFDLQAVAAVYGNASADGTQVASWSWDSGTETLAQTGYGTREKIFGVAVKDVINGRGGNDWIAGFQGRDDLNGAGGNDRIFGGEGGDRLRGGDGLDYLAGNGGNDQFVFNQVDFGRDVIADFSAVSGNNDRLFFSKAAFGALGRAADDTGVIESRHFQATASAEAKTADARFVYDTGTGLLRYDSDGNGVAAATVIAKFLGLPDLTNSDIVIL